MVHKVIDAFNIFADTDVGTLNHNSNGGDFNINFNNTKIDLRDGQSFRISLINFNMSKTFTNVNRYNNRFCLKTAEQPTPLVLSLASTNHKNLRSLVENFALIVKQPLLAYSNAAGGTADEVETVIISPSVSATLEGGSDNILRLIQT